MNARWSFPLLFTIAWSDAAGLQKPSTIPLPYSIVQHPGMYSFSSQSRAILGDGTAESDRDLLEMLNARLEEHGRRRLSLTHERDIRSLPKASVYLASPRSEFVRSALRLRGVRWPGSFGDEDYILDVRQEGIILVASSQRGRSYGMMTLLGLLRRDGRRLLLPNVTIQDRPAQAVRGFRLRAGEDHRYALAVLRDLIPLCGFFKMNTIAVDLTPGAYASAESSGEIRRLRELAGKHWMELQFDRGTSEEDDTPAPLVRLGLLPPGPTMTARVAAWARSMSTFVRPQLPIVSLEAPAVYSSQWLDYCAAWIAEQTWSGAARDVGAFTKAFFRISGRGHTNGVPVLRDFLLLQNSPIEGSWDELWIGPLVQAPCLHSLVRRHAAESLTAGAHSLTSPRLESLSSAVAARMRFLEFLGARLRAEQVLVEALKEETAGAEALESLQTVLDCLDRLELSLLEASGPAFLPGQGAELFAGVAFQRRNWSRILSSIEGGADVSGIVRPPSRMHDPETDIAHDSVVIVFRRQIQCTAPPLQARLVISADSPCDASINDVPLHGALSLPQLELPGPRRTFVLDATKQLRAGENRVNLSVGPGLHPSCWASVVLEIQFRDGSGATIRCDSLWQSSVLGYPFTRQPATWHAVVVAPEPLCPLQVPKP